MAHVLLIVDGGPGSGNFNHGGRPGEVGGSSSSGGGGSSEPAPTKASQVARGRITQPKFKGSKQRKPKVTAREVAALHRELNTHLTPEEREQGVVTKNLFGSYYTVEIIDFDEYNILKRKKADDTQSAYLKEFRSGGKKK